MIVPQQAAQPLAALDRAAVADDLWAALEEASGQPVLELANAWIHAPGYPLVGLAREGTRVRLAQRRFLSEPGAAEPGSWPVPVVLRFADDRGVREQRVLCRGAGVEVALDAEGQVRWVFGNGGSTGFYRVEHADADRAALALHLRELRRIRRDVRVILSSGYSEQDAADGFEADRPSAFLQKPYRPAQLIDMLRALVEADD